MAGGLFAAGCSDPAPGDAIDPSDVTSDDLYGYWYNAEIGLVRTFLPPEDAFYQTLTRTADPASGPVSTANRFTRDFNHPVGLDQAATFSVADGVIAETVLLETDPLLGGPGTEYRTGITAFRSKTSMTLESGNTFQYAPTCEEVKRPGEFAYLGITSENPFSGGCDALAFVGHAEVAVDPNGGVHTMTTVTDLNNSVVGNAFLIPCAPSATYWSGGCDARRVPVDYAEDQALFVDPTTSTVHALQVAEQAGGYELRYLQRPVRTAEGFDATVIVPFGEVSTTAPLALYARGDAGTVVFGNRIFRRVGDTFTEVTPVFPEVGVPELGHGAFDDTGKLYALSNQNLFIEGEDATFEAVPLPRTMQDFGYGHSVAVGANGHVHVVYPYAPLTNSTGAVEGALGFYARYDGNTWHEVQLDAFTWNDMVVDEAGNAVIMHARYRGQGAYILTRVTPEGRVDSWASGLAYPPTPGSWNRPSIGVHGDRMAFTAQGARIGTSRVSTFFDLERERTTVPVTITFQGTGSGRVLSDDGLVDCTADCTVDLPVGKLVHFQNLADPGSIAIAGAGDPVDPRYDLTRTSILVHDARSLTVLFDASVAGTIVSAGATAESQVAVAMATDDERLCMVVTSADGRFTIGNAPLTSAAPSSTNLYVVCGPIEGPYTIHPLPLPAVTSLDAIRLQPGQDLEVFVSNIGAALIDGTPVGEDGRNNLLRATVDLAGALTGVTAIYALPQGTYVRAVATGQRLAALFVEGSQTLVDGTFKTRGVVTVDASGAAQLHTFTGDPAASSTSFPTLDVADDRVFFGFADTLAFIDGGSVLFETTVASPPGVLDAGGPAPAWLGSRPNPRGGSIPEAVLVTLDDAGEVASETVVALQSGGVLHMDTRADAGYAVSLGAAFGSPTPNRLYVDFFDDSAHFEWVGNLTARRITRASGGRAWLEVQSNGAEPASFQGREFPDRRSFLIEMVPAAVRD